MAMATSAERTNELTEKPVLIIEINSLYTHFLQQQLFLSTKNNAVMNFIRAYFLSCKDSTL
jgi:hypothetical protein